MVKPTKLYTKTGDAGTTGLAGQARVKKTDLIIEVIGCLDELNAQLGFSMASLPAMTEFSAIRSMSTIIQHHLFNIGADLCTLDLSKKSVTPCIKVKDITALEESIDQLNHELKPLKSFILPGGHMAAAAFHVTRTVCRRCERYYWQWLATQAQQTSINVTYLNRLSDWLFISSRWINHQTQTEEPLWQPNHY